MHMKTHFSSISSYRDLSLCEFFQWTTLIYIEILCQFIAAHFQLICAEAEQVSPPPSEQDGLTEARPVELETASIKQLEIIRNLEDAINDMNIETANTGTRLNVLETIATRQRQVHTSSSSLT